MKKLFLFLSLIILLILISISEFNPFCQDISENHNFTVIAHRGGANLAPENTISAIQEVLKHNIEEIEIDVHLTKDNIPVVIHDYTIDRTTNGSGKIRQKTYKELLSYDAGSWFSERYKNEIIPTLDQVLKTINGKCNLLIEIKGSLSDYPDIVKIVNQVIKSNNAESWCFIHTFNDEILNEIYSQNKNIKLQKLIILYIPFLDFYIDTAPHFRLNYDNKINAINIYYRFINSCIIKFFHSKGIKVNAWTVNDIQKIRKLKKIGVDGIITDIPDQILKIDY